jgi:hypothetical protein
LETKLAPHKAPAETPITQSNSIPFAKKLSTTPAVYCPRKAPPSKTSAALYKILITFSQKRVLLIIITVAIEIIGEKE